MTVKCCRVQRLLSSGEGWSLPLLLPCPPHHPLPWAHRLDAVSHPLQPLRHLHLHTLTPPPLHWAPPTSFLLGTPSHPLPPHRPQPPLLPAPAHSLRFPDVSTLGLHLPLATQHLSLPCRAPESCPHAPVHLLPSFFWLQQSPRPAPDKATTDVWWLLPMHVKWPLSSFPFFLAACPQLRANTLLRLLLVPWWFPPLRLSSLPSVCPPDTVAQGCLRTVSPCARSLIITR